MHVVHAWANIAAVPRGREGGHHLIAAAAVLDGQHISCMRGRGGREEQDSAQEVLIENGDRLIAAVAVLDDQHISYWDGPCLQAPLLTVHVADCLHDVSKVRVAKVGDDLSEVRTIYCAINRDHILRSK